MFDFSWVEALIVLCLLAAAVFLVRRGLRRVLRPWRRPPDEHKDLKDTSADSRDWTANVLDESRGDRPPDRDPD